MLTLFESIMGVLSGKVAKKPSPMVYAAIKEWEFATNRATLLVKATDRAEIAELEARFGLTQQNAVTHFVEQTEWGLDTFPEFQDREGSPEERLAALRARWHEWDQLK